MSMIEIPAKKLDEGLRLCAQNIRSFIKDSHLLLKGSSGWHAVALVIFAAEELAKYSELKKAMESASVDVVKIDERLFLSHHYKQEIARKLIPRDTMVILPKDLVLSFLPGAIQTEQVEVSPRLRTECMFLDWKDGEWNLGAPLETSRIRRLADAIMTALNRLEAETQRYKS